MNKILLLLITSWVLILIQISSAWADKVQTDLDCLAEAVYYEGRSEPFIGQLAIANVALTRTTKSVCAVVHDRCQFSYWCDGKNENMTDLKARKTSYQVARLALDGALVGETEGATHYHADYVNPHWASKLFYLGRIGKHLFYIEE
jgi:spore germination cell wall hydrolase CwlJ-like protein